MINKKFKLIVGAGIVAMVVLFYLGVTVTAMDVGVNVWSDGDVNVWGNIFANGSVNVNIDGTDVNREFQTLEDSKISYWDLTWMFSQVKDYFYHGPENIHLAAISIFNSLNDVFVNKAEGKVLQDRTDILNVRITALEKAVEQMNNETYCQARIDTMYEFNLKSVTCGAVTYYNLKDKIIGIEEV